MGGRKETIGLRLKGCRMAKRRNRTKCKKRKAGGLDTEEGEWMERCKVKMKCFWLQVPT